MCSLVAKTFKNYRGRSEDLPSDGLSSDPLQAILHCQRVGHGKKIAQKFTHQAGFFQQVSSFATYKLNDACRVVTEGKKALKNTKNPDFLTYDLAGNHQHSQLNYCARTMSLRY